MKTDCFDAAVDIFPGGKRRQMDAVLRVRGERISASLHFYDTALKPKPSLHFVRIHTHQLVLLRWRDAFDILEPGKRRMLGKGYVLNPYSEKVTQTKMKKRIAFLKSLQGDEKDVLSTLVQEKGIQGLKEKEIQEFSSTSRPSLLRLIEELEGEGKIKILSFSPLFLFSPDSLDFLCKKILDFLTRFHKKYPEQNGASLERIEKRFNLHPRVLSLALKHLLHTGQIKEVAEKFALADFEVILTSEDEKILQKLESMCLKGDFRQFSFEDLRRHFHITPQKLDWMLSLLTERKKIIQGKEGLLLHSQWLDEIVQSLKDSGKKEMTIAEFKKITGLSRRYAIPLLELLDQMGVTRRKGSVREIL
jgi:selenocysteine-specific elongation factor